MKSLLIAVLLVLAIAETPEECVRGQCPDEVRACEFNPFCASAALSCYNGCGGTLDDLKCLKECADKSKNGRLQDLDECATAKCGQYLLPNQEECDLVGCVDLFQTECINQGTLLKGVSCTASFFERNPQCECVKNM